MRNSKSRTSGLKRVCENRRETAGPSTTLRSVEKHFQERSAELQIPPLRFASDGMTKGRESAQVLILLVRIGRVLAQDELLYQGIREPAPGIDERVGENQSWPAIARRIVEVCKGGRDQIAANT